MTRVAVATSSALAAEAAREVAALGGNAVDCAIAAAFLSMNTEPGVCALAGGAYVSVWAPNADPVTIDGNVTVPGCDWSGGPGPADASSVSMNYGGGVNTLVGAGSVAVPGSLAALATAFDHYGQAQWADIIAPAVRVTRQGFPLSAACHYYLQHSGEPIFGRSTDGFRALHEYPGGDESNAPVLRPAGSTIVVPHLADSLALIAEQGARAFYEGELAACISRHSAEHGGRLTRADLAGYRAIIRPALQTSLGSWKIASNPPPAVGGAMLIAMLHLFAREPLTAWDAPSVLRLIEVQQQCLQFRKRELDLAPDIDQALTAFLGAVETDRFPGHYASASTVHTSAVDDQGLGCAITASAGYGSGEMPDGTGLWLNNCLGELELNRRGLAAGPVGKRLPSNMAPTVARSGDRTLAAGSPGADRITTALHQFLVNALQLELPLNEAVVLPRLHFDTSGETDRIMAEPGIALPDCDWPVTVTPKINMYFGGVGAVSFDRKRGFDAAADPRREGGLFVA
jgi:gamma-glutamyltranspeptidase/glutathione hydrolase